MCFLIGEAIVKVGKGGPYRVAYDAKYAEYLARPRTGPSECPFGQVHGTGKPVKCPPTGHVHNAAMRYAVKCLLRDMWVEWRHVVPVV